MEKKSKRSVMRIMARRRHSGNNETHPLDAVLAALEMQHVMIHMKREKERSGARSGR
ncbi:MAG: hypothetical protein U1F27_06315 [Turneriella sp.]